MDWAFKELKLKDISDWYHVSGQVNSQSFDDSHH